MSATRAFIVRPFGTKEGINFDKVEESLIAPALVKCGIQGSTTGPFLQAGNIREDMFLQLLVADLVVADVSIHNANVFYELGIRQAMQPQHTFLMRARSKKDPKDRGPQDDVPFDIKTDRYLEYDSDKPEEMLATLEQALKQTMASENQDSPVFKMLPELEGRDRSRFLPVPQAFRDDVDLAASKKQVGLLGLLAMEAKDFFWASEGLRLIGRAQFTLKAFRQAKLTWEELHRLNPADVEANQRLATIYQRLGDLDASNQALGHVINDKKTKPADRAEALSLMGRNIKDRWKADWVSLSGEERVLRALQSPYLRKSYEMYLQAFEVSLDSYYSGLNALSLLTMLVDLATEHPDAWALQFDTDAKATLELESLKAQKQMLTSTVGMSINAARKRLQQSGTEDRWVEISYADYVFLTSDRPARVAFAYRSALADAQDFYFDSARGQIELFGQLGIRLANAEKSLEVFKPGTVTPQVTAAAPVRVVLFTGHMIDAKDAGRVRFPPTLTGAVKDAIRAKLKQEVERTEGTVIGIASGASGGDLLFHEVCEELKIEHRLYLPLPPDRFRNESVSPAGTEWEARFDGLPDKSRFMTDRVDVPLWLSVKEGYTTWQRANLWLVNVALAVGAKEFSLLSLWDGEKTTGKGGVYHMRVVAEECGASLPTILIGDLKAPEKADAAVTGR